MGCSSAAEQRSPKPYLRGFESRHPSSLDHLRVVVAAGYVVRNDLVYDGAIPSFDTHQREPVGAGDYKPALRRRFEALDREADHRVGMLDHEVDAGPISAQRDGAGSRVFVAF